jgi:hypothetical protein
MDEGLPMLPAVSKELFAVPPAPLFPRLVASPIAADEDAGDLEAQLMSAAPRPAPEGHSHTVMAALCDLLGVKSQT